MHPFFRFGGFFLPAYGLMGFVGFALAALYAFLTNKQGTLGQIPNDDLVHLGALAAVGAIIGSKLLYLFTAIPLIWANWDAILQNPSLLVGMLANGFVFYGGLVGALLAIVLYCRKYNLSLKTTAAILTPCVPLFHAFGRIGCFLAGCCWGIEVPWGIAYTHSVGAPNGIPFFPVQPVEAACNLLIFVLLAVCVRKFKQKEMVFPLYIFIYSSLRFVLEFFRGDAVRGIGILSTGQWISAMLVVAMLIVHLVWRGKKRPSTHT